MSAKVFVGNLAFRVTDQDLQGLFQKDCGNDVKSGVVITRGRRSLGFGFVEFSTTEAATAAVEKMKNKELFTRPIKVELAKDPSEVPAKPRNSENQNQGSNNNNNSNNTNNSGGQQRERGEGGRGEGGRGEGGRGGRGSRGGRRGGRGGARGGRRGPARRRRQNDENDNDNENNNNQQQQQQERPPRTPSTTTLYVSNLPFSFKDEDLLAVFKEHNAKSAHVAVTRNNRSRGYGFVEFNNENDQKAALAKDKADVTGANENNRKITVVIAHQPEEQATNETQDNNDNNNDNSNSNSQQQQQQQQQQQ